MGLFARLLECRRNPALLCHRRNRIARGTFSNSSFRNNKIRRTRMSDMRDFSSVSNDAVSEDIRSGDIRPVENFSTPNSDELGEFHVVETEEHSNTGRAIGALAVA